MRLTRRYVVRFAIGAAGTAGPEAIAGRRAVAGTVVKIGIINSLSGFLGPRGDEMQKGIELYAKTHKDDLPTGVGVDLITCDHTSSPEVGKRLAQELIAREKVNVLMGVIGSPETIPKVKDPWKELNRSRCHVCRRRRTLTVLPPIFFSKCSPHAERMTGGGEGWVCVRGTVRNSDRSVR